MERSGVITFQGNPMTLPDSACKAGDKAQAFTLLDGEMKPFGLKDLSGKVKMISVTPSLDTPVCDLQLRRFYTEAAGLPGDIMVLNISMDLPFAIARFCTSAGIDKAKGPLGLSGCCLWPGIRRIDKRAAPTCPGNLCGGQKRCNTLCRDGA